MDEIVAKIIAITLVVLVAGGFGIILATYITEDCKEGTVTDKYILPRFTGEPVYYLVLDNETDVKTTEEYYYKYEVGDYYNPYNR